MTFAPDQRIVRSSETLATEVDGEVVLISIKDGRYFGLDQVGSEIWRRLADPKRVDELCAELQGHFEGDPELIAREAVHFLGTLADSDLVHPA